jgi:hypothetical protein
MVGRSTSLPVFRPLIAPLSFVTRQTALDPSVLHPIMPSQNVTALAEELVGPAPTLNNIPSEPSSIVEHKSSSMEGPSACGTVRNVLMRERVAPCTLSPIRR